MSDWLILRTSGRHTLPLAGTLAKDGYDVWTPAKTLCKRAPRRQARTEEQAPLLPTYVFARACHIGNLIELSNKLVKACPDFSVFHYLNRIPLIADHELAGIRDEEARENRKRRRRTREVRFARGETIRIGEGAFAGMSGIVQHDDGKFTLVCFGGVSVKIATFLLGEERMAA